MVRHHRSPPNSAAAGSEVESVRRSGGAKRRPYAEEVVVGGAVGVRLKVTCRGRPAVSAAARGTIAPAQRSVPCAAAVQVARARSAMFW